MPVVRSTTRPRRQTRPRPLPEEAQAAKALERLARQRALQTLVRGTLAAVARRLLKGSLPARASRDLPDEVWSSLATSIALESPEFGTLLARELHDRLAWDHEPAELDDWWELVREKPLQALWMGALSENRSVRKEFAHIAAHCLENYRSSPDCPPPSWEYVDGLLDVQARTAADLKESERQAEDAERRYQVERERTEEIREELKRLRRETAELRAARAAAERRAEALEARSRHAGAAPDERRIEELERRVRKAEKEREHLLRELERLAPPPPGGAPSAPEPREAERADARAAETPGPPALSEDPNPRRRILRQILRKLFKKGKIGASHTHEDNVYRGVADHEKGIAKEAMELLYREGLLVPKPTATDPHVSLMAERVAEVKAIVAGEIENPRLRRFVGA